MSFLVRRLRAIAIVALLWAVPWSLIGTILNGILGLAIGISLRQVFHYFPLLMLYYGVFGAVCGGSFALLMMLAERGKTLEHLSRKRMMLWGGLGGSLLPMIGIAIVVVLFGGQAIGIRIEAFPLAVVSAISGLLGAIFASTHLKLARQVGPGANQVPSIAEGTG